MDRNDWRELIRYLGDRFVSHGLTCRALSTSDQGLVYRMEVVSATGTANEVVELLVDWQPEDQLVKVHKKGFTYEVSDDSLGLIKLTICAAVLPPNAVDTSLPNTPVVWG